jgi:hypothetical protein
MCKSLALIISFYIYATTRLQLFHFFLLLFIGLLKAFSVGQNMLICCDNIPESLLYNRIMHVSFQISLESFCILLILMILKIDLTCYMSAFMHFIPFLHFYCYVNRLTLFSCFSLCTSVCEEC